MQFNQMCIVYYKKRTLPIKTLSMPTIIIALLARLQGWHVPQGYYHIYTLGIKWSCLAQYCSIMLSEMDLTLFMLRILMWCTYRMCTVSVCTSLPVCLVYSVDCTYICIQQQLSHIRHILWYKNVIIITQLPSIAICCKQTPFRVCY